MSVYVPVKLRRQLREKFHDSCAYCRSSESLADRENTVMGCVTTSVKSIVSVVIHESLPDEANSLVIGHCLCGN